MCSSAYCTGAKHEDFELDHVLSTAPGKINYDLLCSFYIPSCSFPHSHNNLHLIFYFVLHLSFHSSFTLQVFKSLKRGDILDMLITFHVFSRQISCTIF